MPSNEYMRSYMAERRARRLAELTELLGGSCATCNSTVDLEFDHVDPATKAFQISGRGLDKPWDLLLQEAQKCQLLCRDDHIRKTQQERDQAPHGSETRYLKYKCRCKTCRIGYAETRKNYASRSNQSPVV